MKRFHHYPETGFEEIAARSGIQPNYASSNRTSGPE